MTFPRCARGLYRLLLFLHPPAFRERFAGEMLWIFDQSVMDGDTLRVMGDGCVSLVTQWMATDTVPQANPGSFRSVPTGSLSAMRVTQATAVALLLTLGFFKLLTQSVPLPQPPKDFRVWQGRFALCANHRCKSIVTPDFCGTR
jgi:hypothetical protein